MMRMDHGLNIAVAKEIRKYDEKYLRKCYTFKFYTNHPICDSVVDIMEENNNLEARHIVAHIYKKKEASICQYTSKCPPKVK